MFYFILITLIIALQMKAIRAPTKRTDSSMQKTPKEKQMKLKKGKSKSRKVSQHS